MSLGDIVAALGGDLYGGGTRANVPAPGHSPADRSVSLWLAGDRVLIHSFGAADWREVRDHLATRGLIDGAGRPAPAQGPVARPPLAAAAPPPDAAARVRTARGLWDAAAPIRPAALSALHLTGRGIGLDPAGIAALRHHPAVPLGVYRGAGPRRPALLAAVRAPGGALTAVELVYLTPSGRADPRVRLARKTIGVLPPGSAVRLAPAAGTLLVGEGVMTVLSACEALGPPGWALLSARNLAGWTPPPAVRRVLIAADRGAPGEAAAARLETRLRARGLAVRVRPPPAGFEDWNAFARVERGREGG